ncbi:hypothetical protein MPLA_1550028 [Mesorhizobium sp. ORS 3359]|nr:hypothetical protein MPLA_1550028 [Mesorhizobium sp. ORS 3359]
MTPAVIMFRGQNVVHINEGLRPALRQAEIDRRLRLLLPPLLRPYRMADEDRHAVGTQLG